MPSLITRSTIFSTAAGSGRAGGLAVAERADRQRHRRVGPLGGAALVAVGDGVAGADVREELERVVRRRRLGERAADVDAGVVIGAADAGAAVRLDVDEGRQVQLLGARAVARLPDREELRQAAAVTRRQRRLDRVERVRQRGGDLDARCRYSAHSSTLSLWACSHS